MGRRGPLPGTKYGKAPGPVPDPDRAKRLGAPTHPATTTRTLELLPTVEQAPLPPDHLNDLGREVWSGVFTGFDRAVIDHQLDRLAVLRLAECAEDRAAARTLLVSLGPVLTEPIVSPSGAVVGERIVPNPCADLVRKCDKEIDALSAALGLTPQARARLGLTISQAQLAHADAAVVMSRMRRSAGST